MYRGSIIPSGGPHPLVDDTFVQEAAPEASEAPGLGEAVDFAFGFARRQYLVILLCIAAALAGSIVYLRLTPPTYRASAKILFENQKIQFVQQQSIIADAPIDRAQLENQIEILKSKPIAADVIKKLNLVDDPDFNGEPRGFRALLARALEWFGQQPQQMPPPSADDGISDDILAAFDSRLLGMRVGFSNVIEIEFSSSNAQRAAQIANAVAQSYLTRQLDAKLDTNRTATGWLQKRLQELGSEAVASEQAVNQFKARNNVVAVGGHFIDDQQVTELNSRLVAARTQASDALARMNRYESVLNSSKNSANAANASLDAPISDALTNPIINTLRQEYLEYARRETEWSSRFGKNHQAVVNLRARMNDIRTSIASELRRMAEASRNDYETAKQQQQAIEKQLADAVSKSQVTSSADVKMRELETNAKSYRNLYDSFLQQYMRSIQQQSFPVADARIISPALPPQSKSKPKSALVIALGLVCGALAGAGIGFLREITDRAFRTTAQVESALHTACLSLVPLVGQKPQKPRKRFLSRWKRRETSPASRSIVRGTEAFWAASGMPLSIFAESIRFIKLAIDLTPANERSKIIGVTSSLAHEGKSTIAGAIGELIAQAGKRVVVIDCDLRSPSLSASLAPNADAGFFEVVTGQRTLEETIWRDAKSNLAFLPAAMKSAHPHSSDILSSAQTGELLEKLRASYDYIILDLPPLMPIVDVRATVPWVDGFILAIEWGHTKIDIAQKALHAAPDVRRSLIGAVLNKTDMKAIGRYDSNSYHYGYEHYAERAA